MMGLLADLRLHRTAWHRIVSDGLIVSRIRCHMAAAGLAVGDLSDSELERALTQGVYDEMLVRSGRGGPLIHIKGTVKNEAEFAEKVRSAVERLPVGCRCGHERQHHEVEADGARSCRRCPCERYRPNLA